MKQSEPVGDGNIQQARKKPQATVIKHSWKSLNLRLLLDVDGQALGVKNTGKVGLGILWVVILMVLFVVCGTLNTILFKLQNESYSKGVGAGPPRNYEHPFSQGVQMFIGMILFCLPLHWIKENLERCGVMDKLFKKTEVKLSAKEKKKRKKKAVHRPSTYLPDDDYLLAPDTPVPEPTYDDEYENVEDDEEEEEEEEEEGEAQKEEEKLPPINQLLFLIPATCDLAASTLLYIGLIFTYASVYQMLRATVVVFTGILSIVCLKADIYKFPHVWGGVTLICIGTALVGYSSIANEGHGRAKAKDPTLGALMVIAAQVVYAMQFVAEETFLKGYDTDPLQVPGYEGYWGFAIEMWILFILYWIPGNDFGVLENFQATVCQAFSNPALIILILILICNIGIYNFTGNWITKELSAATRTTIDCIRNVLVWVIQLARGRQEFAVVQLIGFIVLVSGTFVYNQVGFNIICPCYAIRMEKWKRCSLKECIFGKKKKDKNDEEKGEEGSAWAEGTESVKISYYDREDDQDIEEPLPMDD